MNPPTRTSLPLYEKGSLGGLLSRLWPLFVTSWLVFVIINPVATMLEASHTQLGTLMSLAWAAVFLAAYLRLVLHKPFRINVSATERWSQIALLILLTGMVLYIDIAYPTGFFWLFIYVIIPAGVLLPPRAAAWSVVAITSLAIGVELARSEWAQAMAVPGIAIWGVSTIMLRRLIVTVEELRAAREELARLAVTEERLRFGRDLHDLLGHSLSLIAIKCELAGRLVQAQGEQAAAEIKDVEQVARRSLREVREAVTSYRQPTLGEELTGAREMLTAAGIPSRFDVTIGALPRSVDNVLAWAIREATTNVARHSNASACDIRLACGVGEVRVSVTDDGCGAAGAGYREAYGSGLAGVAERVASCGGWMMATPVADGGFSLEIGVPIVGNLDLAPELDHATAVVGAVSK